MIFSRLTPPPSNRSGAKRRKPSCARRVTPFTPAARSNRSPNSPTTKSSGRESPSSAPRSKLSARSVTCRLLRISPSWPSFRILAGDSAAVLSHFRDVGGFLENRGTKVDTHVHVIDFGYLALMLAIIQPWVTLSEAAKKRLAILLISGAALLPVGVFLIHYVGLAYSPLEAIGWGSIFADLGGVLVVVACAGELFGLWKNFRARNRAPSEALLSTRSRGCSLLMGGGVLLVLLGFLHGGYYALVDLDRHEALDGSILTAMTSGAAAHDRSAVAKGLG